MDYASSRVLVPMQCWHGSCLAGVLASVWVDMYHAAFMSRSSLEREDSEIKMTLIQQDLSSCLAKLNGKEACVCHSRLS